MSTWPFRYVHAADFHLELPPSGVAEVPDHLWELFVESTYLAAERVFETVLSEEAEFLVLSGDIADPRRVGPRGMLFLAEQFGRLAERQIAVYWAGGQVDPPDAWPPAVRLPENVRVFPTGRPEPYVHHHEGEPMARLVGASRQRGRSIRASDFEADPAGLFSIAVVHGTAEAEALSKHSIHYWALGGSHARRTLSGSPRVAHYAGSPQGRHPGELGPHGCTLVHVDAERRARTAPVSTDVMRWQDERIVVEESTTVDDLERAVHERMQGLVEANPGMDLLISWTVVGSGPAVTQLRRGPLAGRLLEDLRSQYGFGPPAAWSVSLSVEPAAGWPPQWYEQETIRGDFLRQIRRFQTDPSKSLELESYLDEHQRGGSLGSVAELSDQAVRGRVLREAAQLGVDLLSGEEPDS